MGKPKANAINIASCFFQRYCIFNTQAYGKQKAHTFKVQAIIHYKTRQILSLCMCKGAVHDFELFKRNQHLIPKESFVLADKGYQGIYAIYEKSLISIKAKTRM
ncbi:transposase [Acinetobacter bohemicus]|uniref:transposase n=1 Tax=Acinetobacter bohemicus TaxID=1435036 RepID=UPI001BB46AF0|nr:transposase [Acinetobacter bohemicus]